MQGPGLEWCQAAWGAVLASLAAAALADYKYREVDPVFWGVSIKLALPAAIPCWAALPHRAVYAASAAAVAVLTAALYLAGLLGGADFLATALLAAAAPASPADASPAAMLALLYASLASLAWRAAYSCALTLARLGLAREAGGPLPRCLYAVPARIREVRGREWWAPAALHSGVIARDPPDLVAEAAGEAGEDAVIWAAPATPFLPWMLLGALAAYTLGVRPLQPILQALGGG